MCTQQTAAETPQSSQKAHSVALRKFPSPDHEALDSEALLDLVDSGVPSEVVLDWDTGIDLNQGNSRAPKTLHQPPIKTRKPTHLETTKAPN
jgi:hypothetical protein